MLGRVKGRDISIPSHLYLFTFTCTAHVICTRPQEPAFRSTVSYYVEGVPDTVSAVRRPKSEKTKDTKEIK